MKTIAISGISSANLWQNDHHTNNWHYSTSKRSQDKFRPLNLPSTDHNNNNLNQRNQNYSTQQQSNKVCRCLFGPSDPTETRREVYELLNNSRYVDRERWNFDFHKEKPLSGRYEWFKMGEDNNNKKRSGDNINNNALKLKNIWSSTSVSSKSITTTLSKSPIKTKSFYNDPAANNHHHRKFRNLDK